MHNMVHRTWNIKIKDHREGEGGTHLAVRIVTESQFNEEYSIVANSFPRLLFRDGRRFRH